MVAECLGKLTLIDPAVLLPKLKEHLQTPSPLIRATVVTAVKFTISEQVSCLAGVQLDHWLFSTFTENTISQYVCLNVVLCTSALMYIIFHTYMCITAVINVL